jgi:hypothetical protein
LNEPFYLAVKYDAPLTAEQEWRILRQRIARETGWTLEYIDQMGFPDLEDFLDYEEVIGAIREQAQERSARQMNRRR